MSTLGLLMMMMRFIVRFSSSVTQRVVVVAVFIGVLMLSGVVLGVLRVLMIVLLLLGIHIRSVLLLIKHSISVVV